MSVGPIGTPLDAAYLRTHPLADVPPPGDLEYDRRSSDPDPDPLSAAESRELLGAQHHTRDGRALVVQRGPSWDIVYPGARLLEPLRLVFRDVRTDDGLRADVSAYWDGELVTRTATSLSLTSRGQLARRVAETVAYRFGLVLDRAVFDDAVERAVLGVLEREDEGEEGVDLRTAALPEPGSERAVDPLVDRGPSIANAPSETGKSSVARAIAVSCAGIVEVIPGVVPRVFGPVLYVAGEAAVVASHAKSIEAICRGIGVSRADLEFPITMIPTRGRPLHRLARMLAERAHDAALVIIDSYQSVQATGGEAGIREREGLTWAAIDEIDRPTLVVAHPTKEDARSWAKADGRVAGSEVSRDRARLAWRLTHRDVTSPAGARREYTATCTKANDYGRWSPLGFTAWWTDGSLRFTASDPFDARPVAAPMTDAQRATLEAWWGGARTPAAMADALHITPAAAKKRIQRLREDGLIQESPDDSD